MTNTAKIITDVEMVRVEGLIANNALFKIHTDDDVIIPMCSDAANQHLKGIKNLLKTADKELKCAVKHNDHLTDTLMEQAAELYEEAEIDFLLLATANVETISVMNSLEQQKMLDALEESVKADRDFYAAGEVFSNAKVKKMLRVLKKQITEAKALEHNVLKKAKESKKVKTSLFTDVDKAFAKITQQCVFFMSLQSVKP